MPGHLSMVENDLVIINLIILFIILLLDSYWRSQRIKDKATIDYLKSTLAEVKARNEDLKFENQRQKTLIASYSAPKPLVSGPPKNPKK
jgi:hypothetical protein